VCKVLVGKSEGKRALGRQGVDVDESVGSEWILGRLAGGGLDSSGSG
jgi:hypothetical protein